MGGWLSLVAFGEIGGQISWRVIGDAFQLRAFYKKHSETELDDLLRLTQKMGSNILKSI